MSGNIRETLVRRQVKNIRDFRSVGEFENSRSTDKNLESVRDSISVDIGELKFMLFDVLWCGIVKDDPEYKNIISQMEASLDDPQKKYFYIDTDLPRGYVNFELYADSETAKYITILKPLFEQFFNLKNEIRLHCQTHDAILDSIRQEILNGREELTSLDIEKQEQSEAYLKYIQESKNKSKQISIQIESLSDSLQDLTLTNNDVRVIQLNIDGLTSQRKKMQQSDRQYLVRLAQQQNPGKVYITSDRENMQIYGHVKYKEFMEKKEKLESEKKLLNKEIDKLQEEFKNYLNNNLHSISSLKDTTLKRKLANEARKYSKAPTMPFYELRKYLTAKSFVILPDKLTKENTDTRFRDSGISDEEKSQFFQAGDYLVSSHWFGNINVIVKSKNNQKFLYCEFENDSLKVIDYDDDSNSFIAEYKGGKYKLEFKLIKNDTYDKIELNLCFTKVGNEKETSRLIISSHPSISRSSLKRF